MDKRKEQRNEKNPEGRRKRRIKMRGMTKGENETGGTEEEGRNNMKGKEREKQTIEKGENKDK